MKNVLRNLLILMTVILLSYTYVNSQSSSAPVSIKEITFYSVDFKIAGELKLPDGIAPHPVISFVHGDGPNSRNSGGSYPPVMERMLHAGYATFAWDKSGIGESTGQFNQSHLLEQRSQIVLDAIKVL